MKLPRLADAGRTALLLALAAPLLGAAEVRGRVLVDDRPLAGATVSAIPYETPVDVARRDARRGPLPKALAAVKTAAGGLFAVNVTSPATARFRLLVEGPSVAPTLTAAVYDASQDEDAGDVSAPRAAHLAGRVVDEKGAPLPGAEVTLESGGAGGPFAAAQDVSMLPHAALTGVDGSFRFDDAAPQGNRVRVEARGFAAAERSGLREGVLARPIVMRKGLSLSGEVRSSDGRAPAAGALVRFEGSATSRFVEAGPDGRFRLTDLPAGTGTLFADGGAGGVAERPGVRAGDAQARLSLVLAPAAAIHGHVVDAKSGKPLAHVRVLARAGEAGWLALSGADGAYRIDALVPRRYRVEADDPRYVPYERDGIVLQSGSLEKVDLPLTLGASLAGRVVDEDGAPVAGARGRLALGGELQIAAFFRQRRGGGEVAFRSGADGTFKATRLTPGDNQRLTVTAADYEPQTLGGLSLAPGALKSGVTVVMRHGLTLAGVVKDDSDKPVAGAEVQLNQMRTLRGGRGGARMVLNFVGGPDARPSVQSGSDGRFEFKGLAPGDYSLLARKSGLADASLDPVKVAAGMDPVALSMGQGATISGTVVDTSGQPAEGYVVEAVRAHAGGSPASRFASREPTGPDGAFLADGLRAGETYDLLLMGPGAPGTRTPGVTAPADGVQLQAPGRGAIAGKVVDAQSGAALKDFEVSFSPDRSAGGRGFVIRVGGPGRRGGEGQRQAVHSDAGAFLLEDVPPGTWQVNVEAKGYEDARIGGVVVESGKTKDGVEVRASQGSAIRGRVLDLSNSQPVANAQVTAQVVGGAGRPPMAGLFGQNGVPTDADGAFEIDGLSPGRYLVSVTHPDYADASQQVEVKDAVAAAEIRLDGGGSIGGGVISDTQRPLAGASVALQAAGEGGGRMGFLAAMQTTLSDDSGHFRFDHLSAGRYTLVASLRERSSAPVDVPLQAGETRQDVSLALAAGATLRGSVSGLPDAELAGVNVFASGPDEYSASVRTASDGSFELDGVPVGAIQLRATAGDFLSGTRSASTQLTIAQGQVEASAQIAFEQGFSVSGRVTKGGDPVTDAFVIATLRGSGRTSTGRSDASGNYSLEGLPAGTYDLNASSPESGSARAQQVELKSDTTVDLAIPVASISGTVLESGSRMPLADAQVSADSSQGGRSFRMAASTDSAGRFALQDLEPKSYTLTTRRAGFLYDTRSVTASEQPSDGLVIELTRGEGIGLIVKDGIYGVPLRGVLARATDASGNAAFMGSVALDSDGRGEIPSLQPGSYQVALSASGYAPVFLSVAVPSAALAVALTPGGSVELHVGPASLASGTAVVSILDARGLPYPLSLFGPAGSLTVSTPVRRLDNLAPGRYTAVVEGQKPVSFAVSEGGVVVVELP
jgi:large repetitive protein